MAFLDGIIKIDSGWVSSRTLENKLKLIRETLDGDLDALQKDAAFVFSTSGATDSDTEQNVELLRRWHFLGAGPSLMAMCIFATENMRLELSEEVSQALLLASVLGEIDHTNPYHSNMHFKKVLLQTMRMTAMHNDIYAGTEKILSDEDIALLLIAACIHDLGHDGKGNTVKGVIKPGHLEEQSFHFAKPYLKAVGLDDESKLQSLYIMLLGTDTAPLDDQSNFMNQMKAAYRYHYLGEDVKTHALNLDPKLAPLQRDKKLALMSIILHEADIATSAGLSYAITKYETSIFMQELKKEEAHPQQVIDFLNQICQRKFLSDAGQRLYAANLARIYALAEEDIKGGNHAFPKPEHSDFLIAYGSGDSDDNSSKTIN